MILIFDAMNIACRSHYVYDVKQARLTSLGIPSGTIYGVLRNLYGWRRDYPHAEMWFCWEGVDSVASRRAIHAEYKTGRAGGMEETWAVQLQALQGALTHLGVHQMAMPQGEADDCMGHLASNWPGAKVLVTSDRDMLQCVDPQTVVMTPDRKRVWDEAAVRSEFGVSSSQFLAYKVLCGDKSDNLPGLRRVPKKVITAQIVEHNGDLDAMYDKGFEHLTPYQKKTFEEFQPQMEVNRKIMSFHTHLTPQIALGTFNAERLKADYISPWELDSLETNLLSFAGSGFFKKG